MSTILNLNQTQPFAGLGTLTWTAAVAGPYIAEFKSFLPAGSALQVVVNQNGSPILTVGGSASNPTPTQQILGSAIGFNAAANDVITIVLSSANAVDSAPNAGVKSILDIQQAV